MGYFSWKTSDTQRSISNESSSRGAFTVHMITEDGQVFTEESYEGYGVFGGKDIYELIAEMNNLKTTEEPRIAAIGLLFKTQITNGEKTYTQGTSEDADFFNWGLPLEQEGGKTPNQLIKEGWKTVYPNGYGDFKTAAANGIKLPKLVEILPVNGHYIKRFFNLFPYPENCDDQGYFYVEEDETEDEVA